MRLRSLLPLPAVVLAALALSAPALAAAELHATLGYAPTSRAGLLQRQTAMVSAECSAACSGTLRLSLGAQELATVKLTNAATTVHRVTLRLSDAACATLRRQHGKRLALRLSGDLRDGQGRTAAPVTELRLG